MDCLFCKISKGEIPCHKIWEDEDTMVFLDIKPITKGHTVVIPKCHSETLFDLPDELVEKLFLVVKKISEHLKNKLRADGLNVGINMRKAAGQLIDHLHIHILPRFEEDGGGSMHSIIYNPPSESLEEILEKVKM